MSSLRLRDQGRHPAYSRVWCTHYVRRHAGGADTGGTFTDVVSDDGRIAKVLSSPDDPGRAVREGVAALDGGRPALLAHGTTVATNALLEGRGAPVALVTTEGLRDVIEIARQDRPSLYDARWSPRATGAEGMAARGGRPPGRRRPGAAPGRSGALPEIPEGAAVAVCLLHADLDSAHEQVVAAALRFTEGTTSPARMRCRLRCASTSAR